MLPYWLAESKIQITYLEIPTGRLLRSKRTFRDLSCITTREQFTSSFFFRLSVPYQFSLNSPMKPFILGSFFTLFIVTIGMNQLYLRVNPSRSYHQKHRHQQSEKKDNRQLTESSLFILKKNKPREVRLNYGRRRPVRYKLVPCKIQ